MASMKLVKLPVTADQLDPSVIFNPINPSHDKASYTLDAGAEEPLASVTGVGIAIALFQGDGDGVFKLKVYVDGSPKDEISTNEPAVGAYAFASSLQIKLYNPGTSSATQSSATFSLAGLARG